MLLGRHMAHLHIQKEVWAGAAQSRKWIEHPEKACGETQRVGEVDIGR